MSSKPDAQVMKVVYALMFFSFCGAGACAIIGYMEYELASRSSAEPEEISLRDLVKRGPDGNPNIILKDFNLLDEYVTKKKKVWIPIVPANEEEIPGKQPAIKAFLYGEDLGDNEQVAKRFDHPTLRCMVDVHADGPGIIGGMMISKRYPGTDTNHCIILVEGKEPASKLKLAMFGIGAVLLLLLTGLIWYGGRKFAQIEVSPKPRADTGFADDKDDDDDRRQRRPRDDR